MATRHDAQAAGERVEALLAELRSRAGPRAAAVAEELVTCLVGLYGAGLDRIAAILAEDGDRGRELLAKMAADPLVEGLLLVHDLHPLDPRARVQRAIDGASVPATITCLGIDERGMVRLRLEPHGHACGSSVGTIRQALTEAVAAAAPETAGVDLEEVAAPPALLQITRRPAEAK